MNKKNINRVRKGEETTNDRRTKMGYGMHTPRGEK
jgi:hypothetical protein